MRSQTLAFAKELRRRPTLAEDLFWKAVRGKQLGVRVRRQEPTLGWIADFYIAGLKLVIELDGPGHSESKDRLRDRVMRAHGLEVWRIPNQEVYNSLSAVLDRLKKLIEKGEGPRSNPT